jgi:hypothetical protein
MVSSRAIERACREHVTFIALSGDNVPHFTTIADFVGALGKDIANVFTQVPLICDGQGLIGREMFAIDGVKLPSNPSKAKSGTRADFERQAGKLEAAVETMLARRRAQDAKAVESDLHAKESERLERLQRDAAQIRKWLAANPEDRRGTKGGVRKSNRTDNESAKMATGKGVLQGYTGVAAVDASHQNIIKAQAHGSGSEQELLVPMVDAIADLIEPDTLLTDDPGYHSDANLQALAEREIEALIADNGMRQRDERFAGQDPYKALPDPLHDKSVRAAPVTLYAPADFRYDPQTQTCICLAGKPLYRHGRGCVINGYARCGSKARSATVSPARSAPAACAIRSGRRPDRWPSSKARLPAVRNHSASRCGGASIAPKDGRATGRASPRWNRCSAICVTTSA